VSQDEPCGLFADFSIQPAVGYANLTYTWRHDGVPLTNGATAHGSNINGANASLLSIFNLQSADAGEYDCVLSNECGGESSATATLAIISPCCPGDLSGDQSVDIDDLLECIGQWGVCNAPNGCNADIAPPGGNGVIDIDDLLTVINGWGTCL
jgi:hypothetical protein